jgi:hypothetical protein
MNHRCVEHSELAAISRLPEDDPRRREADECPRCAARLAQYVEFMDGFVPPEGDMEGADARLAEFMDDVFDRQLSGAGSAPETPERTGFFDWLGRLLLPRPALAGAAVLLVVVVAVTVWKPWSTDPPVLRNDVPAGQETAAVVTLPPSTADDGSLVLSWEPLEGADGYRIRIRSQELAELAVFGPIPGTSFTLDSGLLPPDAPDTVWWEVIATSGGDEIARSNPAAVQLP